MSKVEMQLNSRGIVELMKSPEIVKILQENADSIVQRCPNGVYETSQFIGRSRANVSIATRDKETYFRNLNDNELLKALGGSK